MTYKAMPPTARFVVLCTDLPAAGFLLQRLESYREQGIAIEVATPQEARQPRLLRDVSCPVIGVFIPGARSSQPFREQMGPKGFEYLREFVRQGGSLIGICQGFYLLSDTIHYLPADGSPAKGSRQNLGLLPGITLGDLRAQLGPTEKYYAGWHSTTVAQLRVQLPGERLPTEVSTFYWGGPVYLPHAEALGVQALGHYDIARVGVAPPIAIAARSFGKGRVLGIGPHLEVSSDMLLHAKHLHLFDHDDGSYRRQLAAQLKPYDHSRAVLFDRLLRDALPGHEPQLGPPPARYSPAP